MTYKHAYSTINIVMRKGYGILIEANCYTIQGVTSVTPCIAMLLHYDYYSLNEVIYQVHI